MNANEPLCERCGLTRHQHQLVETDDSPQLACVEQSSEVVDESEINEATPVSRTASEALASWDRTLAKLEDPKFRVPKFMEAATEVLRLAKLEGKPAQRQQLIDDLFEMAMRHGVSERDVQTHMAIVGRTVERGDDVGVAGHDQPPPVDSYEAYGGNQAAAMSGPSDIASRTKLPLTYFDDCGAFAQKRSYLEGHHGPRRNLRMHRPAGRRQIGPDERNSGAQRRPDRLARTPGQGGLRRGYLRP